MFSAQRDFRIARMPYCIIFRILRYHICATGALHGSGAISSSSVGASLVNATSSGLLRFRPRLLVPFAFSCSFPSLSARFATWSSQLMTFAFPSTTGLADRRNLASSVIVVKNRIWSCWRAPLAKDIWVALVSFCTCLCRLCLVVLSSV